MLFQFQISHQTAIYKSQDATVASLYTEVKTSIVKAALTELHNAKERCSIPSEEEINNASKENPIDWNALDNFCIGPEQSNASFEEQKVAISSCICAINEYENPIS